MPTDLRAPVDEVVVAAATGEMVAVFYAGGIPVHLEFGGRKTERRLGEIVLGRVRRVERDLDAAFIDIGDNCLGFANRTAIGGAAKSRRLPGEGDAVLVQISREADTTKLAKLTGRIALPGRTLIYRPGETDVRLSRGIADPAARQRLSERAADLPRVAGGWFVRTAAAFAQQDTLRAEAEALVAQWRDLEAHSCKATAPARLYRPPDLVLTAIADCASPHLQSIRADDPGVLAAIRAHLPDLETACRLDLAIAPIAVEPAIEAALEPTVALSGGGAVHFAETPALVAIDVDARNRHGGGGEQTALAVNLEAVGVIVHQIGLRDLSGHLVIDFVDLRRRAHRERVVAALRAAFAGDRRETHVGGYTRLGKVELTRRRLRGSVRDRLGAPCPVCHGSGTVPTAGHAAHASLRAALRLGREAAAAPALTIVAAPEVTAALDGPAADGRAAVERRLGRRLVLRADAGMATSGFRVERDTEGSS